MIYLFETPQPVVARIALGVRERELQDQSQNDGFESTWTKKNLCKNVSPSNKPFVFMHVHESSSVSRQYQALYCELFSICHLLVV